MKKMRFGKIKPSIKVVWFWLFLIFLIGCTGTDSSSTKIPTVSPEPSKTLVPSKTPVPTKALTNTPTPTSIPQKLGRILPEEFHDQAIWSNAGGNASRNYRDTGWFCPPDGTDIDCAHLVIHFDIALPAGFQRSDFLLSPVNGVVKDIYLVGDGESSVVISPSSPLDGVQELLGNEDRITTLAKGIFDFSYMLDDVVGYSLHLAHVVPVVSVGEVIETGQPIGHPFLDHNNFPPGVGFVIYLHMSDGTYWQFGPCDILNEDEYCGKCYEGTIYPCP